MTEGVELKPCPFCNGEAAFGEVESGPTVGGVFVECQKCWASTSAIFPEKCDARPLLAEKWNARAGLAAAYVRGWRDRDAAAKGPTPAEASGEPLALIGPGPYAYPIHPKHVSGDWPMPDAEQLRRVQWHRARVAAVWCLLACLVVSSVWWVCGVVNGR